MTTCAGITQNVLGYGPALLGAAILLALVALVLAWAAPRNRSAAAAWQRVRRRPVVALALALVVLALAVATIYAGRVAARDEARAREARLAQLSSNLLPNAQLWDVPPPATITWEISGTIKPTGDTAGVLDGEARSAYIWVRPGDRYAYSFSGGTTSVGQIVLEWHNAVLGKDNKSVLSWDAFPICGQPAFVSGTVVAPPEARFLRVLLRSGDGPLSLDFARVAVDGVGVDPWPNGARAALAYSFDWETAMGGLIHSRGYTTPDVADAERRGLAMRQGTDFLIGLFKQFGVHATFYGNGYNMLDGNAARRTFAGNPTYDWANTEARWASDYWQTHPWYSFDPFLTFKEAPAWYFGDQTRALMAAGHEIASHTFGHIYVRGATPQQLDEDAAEWDRAAQAIGLPWAASFAFPWQSSNSVTADFYQVLAAHGIGSVTRLYPLDLQTRQDMFQITALSVYTPLAVMPDFQLGRTAVANEESGQEKTASEALQIIDELIVRRGATSFWNHPEVLAQPEVQAVWTDVVRYAAGRAANYDLYIAPVSEIVRYRRNMDQVHVAVLSSADPLRLEVTNNASEAMPGVTLDLPGVAVSATASGQALRMPRTDQLILPTLQPGEKLTVEVKMETGA